MCDTMVVTGEATLDGVTVFGKNSDRAPNEAQQVISVPAAEHPAGSRVMCTYIEIPQAARTHAVLLANPFWIWGAEMGVNQHGVAIGNEAVFTKVPYDKQPGLIGMDFLRLALERAATAWEAVTVITGLLGQYGQSGNCGFGQRRYYHNSFLIADPHDAWVLETAGKHWAAKQVHGVYTISNGITIGKDYDLASPDLVAHAIHKGWCKGQDDFDFARCYSDTIYTTFRSCRARRQCTLDALSAQQGKNSVSTLIAALRSHGRTEDPDWSPDRGLAGAMVCMHASFGPIRGSQTTGSLASHLHPEHATHFVTGSAAPCTSIFKPVWLDAPLPDMGPAPGGTFSAGSLFWQHELLHRATLNDYVERLRAYEGERNVMEQRTLAAALAAAEQPAERRAALSAQAFAGATAAEELWLGHVQSLRQRKSRGWLHRKAWAGFNRQARMPDG